MKGYINYYVNKDVYDSVAEILVEVVDEEVQALKDIILEEIKCMSSGQFLRAKDKIAKLSRISHRLENDSAYINEIDLSDLVDTLGEFNERKFVDDVFSELSL